MDALKFAQRLQSGLPSGVTNALGKIYPALVAVHNIRRKLWGSGDTMIVSWLVGTLLGAAIYTLSKPYLPDLLTISSDGGGVTAGMLFFATGGMMGAHILWRFAKKKTYGDRLKDAQMAVREIWDKETGSDHFAIALDFIQAVEPNLLRYLDKDMTQQLRDFPQKPFTSS